MFLGQYRHQLDAKGRVAVPAQFRKGLGAGSVVGPGPESRLMIWPADEWEQTALHFRRSAETEADRRLYIRTLFANARELELDGQGRMLLTQEQRQFAGIADRAVFVGIGNVVELLGEERWDGETASITPEHFTALHDRVNAGASAAEVAH